LEWWFAFASTLRRRYGQILSPTLAPQRKLRARADMALLTLGGALKRKE